jgi:hypothetical protein
VIAVGAGGRRWRRQNRGRVCRDRELVEPPTREIPNINRVDVPQRRAGLNACRLEAAVERIQPLAVRLGRLGRRRPT